MKNEVSRIPSRGNDKSIPPNYMKCKKTVQAAVTQRSPGAGSEQVRELLEGFQVHDRWEVLMTPSRTEPAPPERPGAFANAAWGARRVSTSRAPQSSWSRNPGPVPRTGTLRGQQRELSGLSAWTGVRGGSAGLEGSEHGSQAAL